MNRLVSVIFYGNVFYGLCTVLLCIETNMLHGLSLNVFPFYLLIFFCTWIYYTMIYVRSANAKDASARNQWYVQNLSRIKAFLWVTIALVCMMIVYMLWGFYSNIPSITGLQWLLIMLVPFAAFIYTFSLPIAWFKKLRQVGWLKPMLVGITWAGWVTIYPIVIWQLQKGGSAAGPVLPNYLFLLQNFIFITILAILFDIKDYHSDARHNLETYPVALGITNTYRHVLIPAAIVNVVVFILYQWQQSFSSVQIVLQALPHLLLLGMMLRHYRPKNILFYLVFIDGLLFLKAILSIISIQFL